MCFTHWADLLSFKYLFEFGIDCAHLASWALWPFTQDHVFTWGNTYWDVIFALWTVKLTLWELEIAMRTHRKWFRVIFLLHWLSCNWFNLLLEFWSHLINVLWSNQDTWPVISFLFQTCLSTLSNSCSQNIDCWVGELWNIVTDSNEHPCSSHVIAHLDKTFRKLEWMNQSQLNVEIEWNFKVMSLDIFVSI